MITTTQESSISVRTGVRGYDCQVNRLIRLGIPSFFGVQADGFRGYLARFGITPSLIEDDSSSIIVLPSMASKIVSPDKDSEDRLLQNLLDYFSSLFPSLDLSNSTIEGLTSSALRREGRLQPYVLQGVQRDCRGEIARMIAENEESASDMKFMLSEKKRIGLSLEEIIYFLAYDSGQFNAFWPLYSMSENGVIVTVEPHQKGRWILKQQKLSNLMENVRISHVGSEKIIRRWTNHYGTIRTMMAPTAGNIFPF